MRTFQRLPCGRWNVLDYDKSATLTEMLPIRLLNVSSLRHKVGICFRLLAAAVGGYVLAQTVAIYIGLALPIPKAEAVMTGFMLSFILHLAAILWVFAAQTAWRAWLGLLLPSALFTAGSWVLR